MTKTNNEVKLYMKFRNKFTQEVAAAKVGMSRKTGHKYESLEQLPSTLTKKRDYKTRYDPFELHKEYIRDLVVKSPRLKATTILNHLIEKYPDHGYKICQLRTLERRVRHLNCIYGAEKEVYFPQEIKPGFSSQSDWTNMNALKITIGSQHFKHLLFHFMLPFSRWESIYICYSESFESLANGYQKAVWELGRVPPNHKTDNSSTATKPGKKGRDYTTRYSQLLAHYQVAAYRNNPGKGHENGSVEKSHDLFKIAVDQALLIRGYREFGDIEEYRLFLEKLVVNRNQLKVTQLTEEIELMQQLPLEKYEFLKLGQVKVNKFSLVNIESITY